MRCRSRASPRGGRWEKPEGLSVAISDPVPVGIAPARPVEDALRSGRIIRPRGWQITLEMAAGVRTVADGYLVGKPDDPQKLPAVDRHRERLSDLLVTKERMTHVPHETDRRTPASVVDIELIILLKGSGIERISPTQVRLAGEQSEHAGYV